MSVVVPRIFNISYCFVISKSNFALYACCYSPLPPKKKPTYKHTPPPPQKKKKKPNKNKTNINKTLEKKNLQKTPTHHTPSKPVAKYELNTIQGK